MRRVRLASVVAAALIAPIPSGASAATTIGETFDPPVNCVANFTYIQPISPGGRYAAPAAGVITSWSYQADADDVPRLKFKVARPLGGNLFTIVGEGPLVTPTASALNTYPIQIAVQPGDLIGFYLNDPAGISRACGRQMAGYNISFNDAGGDVPPGTTATFSVDPDPAQLDVSANLETTPCDGRPPTIAGTAGDDELNGTEGDDVILGLGGNDRISGLGGSDAVCGGDGRDALRGGLGKDKLVGQGGTDKLVGQGGKDKLLGKGGKDKLNGGTGKDVCKGGKKDDTAKKCEVEKSI